MFVYSFFIESDSDSDKDFVHPAKSEPSKIPDKKAAKDESDSDSDSIDWDSTESSSESDLDEKGAPMELTASMFLKK